MVWMVCIGRKESKEKEVKEKEKEKK